MKLIIIEGPDRTGKDTLAKFLMDKEENTIYRHFTVPRGNSNREKTAWQKYSFDEEFELFNKLWNNFYFKVNTNFVWNRSHIGEHVYGNLYRNSDSKWVFNLEKEYKFDTRNVFLILLTADAEFTLGKDDGDSLSSKLEDRKTEIKLFDEAFEKSHIKNKLKLKINEGNDYASKANIQDEVLQFLGYEF